MAGVAVFVLLASMVPGLLAADTAISIKAADTTVKQELLHLDAVADIQLPEQLRSALESGVDLAFVAEVKISGKREWLPDKTRVSLEIVRRISFHALTGRYVVDDPDTKKASRFDSLESALSELGKYRNIPLVSREVIDRIPDVRILLRVRLAHDKLPLPLRIRGFFSATWKLSSDWYTWPLN